MTSEESELKKTLLYDRHVELGGRMVPFAGWSMPVQYEGAIKEHTATRTSAGVFDISHMGEFLIEGKDTIPYLQKLMTNDLNILVDGKAQYSCMCYPNGTVVDDVFYYRENSEKIRIIVNGANLDKDYKWMTDHMEGFDVKLENQSADRSRFAYQGPKTEEFLKNLIETDLSTVKRFQFAYTKIKNPDNVNTTYDIFIARTGYTGEDGFEITCNNKDAVVIFDILLKSGATPCGLASRDSLRLEVCYSLYGHEINESITPVEASIGWAIKPKEGINFIGKNVLLKQKKDGTERILVGINLIDRGVIRNDFKVFKDGTEIGYITSGGYGPSLKKTIGLALIKKEFSGVDTEIEIEIRGKMKKGIVVKTPFLKK